MLDARVDRLEAALGRLADAQAQTQVDLRTLTGRVEQLAEAQRRTEEHLEELAQHVDRLAEHLQALTARVDRLTEQLQILTARVDRLDSRVGELVGWQLEHRHRDRASAYFQRVLARLRLVSQDELARVAYDAEARGTLAASEREDLLYADVVAEGRATGQEVAYLLAEVSVVVDSRDVERAIRRAAILRKAVAAPVIPVVAGESVLPEAEAEAHRSGVWRVLDGHVAVP